MLFWEWIKNNPELAIQLVLALWAVLNIVWAQWPKPKDPRLELVWRVLHHIFGLIATHATTKGTFTWPFFLKYFAKSLHLPTRDPFDGEPEDHKENFRGKQ